MKYFCAAVFTFCAISTSSAQQPPGFSARDRALGQQVMALVSEVITLRERIVVLEDEIAKLKSPAPSTPAPPPFNVVPPDFAELYPKATGYAEGRISRDLVLVATRLPRAPTGTPATSAPSPWTPTGVVVNNTKGCAIIGDSTGSKIWINLAGTWKSVAVA